MIPFNICPASPVERTVLVVMGEELFQVSSPVQPAAKLRVQTI